MTRESEKLKIRMSVIVDVKHIDSLKKADEVVDKIFDNLEAKLKAKDEEIERLKEKYNEILYTPYKKMAREELKAERKKTRSIVAMLFWDMKKYDRYSKVNNVQDYVNNKNKFFVLELVFKKAYKMIKNNA